jgi:hypothetical protein
MMRLRFREVLVEWRRAERELAHDQAAVRNAVRQLAVPGRVDTVQSRAGHGHRHRCRAARVIGRIERAFVGRAVDAERKPRYHRDPGFAKARAKARAFDAPCGVALRLPTMAMLFSSCVRSNAGAPSSCSMSGGSAISSSEAG